MEDSLKRWWDYLLFWTIIVCTPLGWPIIFVALLSFIYVPIFAVLISPTYFWFTSLPSMLFVWIMIISSVISFFIWATRAIKSLRNKEQPRLYMIPIKNKILRIALTIFIVFTFFVFIIPAILLPMIVFPSIGQQLLKLETDLTPNASSGIVKLSVISAERITKNDYDIEIAVENTEPWETPSGEIYLGGESAFDLKDAQGDSLTYSSFTIDYKGHEDYISPGESARLTLRYKGVENKPARLSYESYYTNDRPIEVDFSSILKN